MAHKKYEMIVIGAGAAGSGVASSAAKQGKRVLQIEKDNLGGTCLNYGCDPTKTLLNIAGQLHQALNAEALGLHIPEADFSWPRVQEHLHQVVDQLRGGDFEQGKKQLQESGIDVIRGEAHFVSPKAVMVNGETIEGDSFVICVGSQTVVPSIEGLKETGYLTNVEAIWLSHLPRSMAILGGGANGIEFSQLFHRFNVSITTIDSGPRILDKEDAELAEILQKTLRDEGLRLLTNTQLTKVRRAPEGKILTLKHKDGSEQELVVDEILIASGRAPKIEALNLEAAGVQTEKGAVKVDEHQRTNVPHIWAAGDVTNMLPFTHVASEQGRIAGHNAFSDKLHSFTDLTIPWVMYTDPPLAHVGKTEEQLKEAKTPYKALKVSYTDIERALLNGQMGGLIKLLVDYDGELLGGHILGPNADDLIGQVTIAMQNHLKIDQLANTVMPYPTLSEGLRAAANKF